MRVCFRSILQNLIFSSITLLSISGFADEGDFAAEFSLPHLLKTESYTLSNYRGSVVLVDFWASWCGPCRASFPAYETIRETLQAKYGKDRFEVLAINVDMDKPAAFEFIHQQSVSFPVLEENTGGKTQHHYQILAMPSTFLIDQQGKIILQHSGFNSAYAELILKLASELLERQK